MASRPQDPRLIEELNKWCYMVLSMFEQNGEELEKISESIRKMGYTDFIMEIHHNPLKQALGFTFHYNRSSVPQAPALISGARKEYTPEDETFLKSMRISTEGLGDTPEDASRARNPAGRQELVPQGSEDLLKAKNIEIAHMAKEIASMFDEQQRAQAVKDINRPDSKFEQNNIGFPNRDALTSDATTWKKEFDLVVQKILDIKPHRKSKKLVIELYIIVRDIWQKHLILQQEINDLASDILEILLDTDPELRGAVYTLGNKFLFGKKISFREIDIKINQQEWEDYAIHMVAEIRKQKNPYASLIQWGDLLICLSSLGKT